MVSAITRQVPGDFDLVLKAGQGMYKQPGSVPRSAAVHATGHPGADGGPFNQPGRPRPSLAEICFYLDPSKTRKDLTNQAETITFIMQRSTLVYAHQLRLEIHKRRH